MGSSRKRGIAKDKPGKKGRKKKQQSSSHSLSESEGNASLSADDQLSSDQDSPAASPKKQSVKGRKALRRNLNSAIGQESDDAETKKMLKARIQSPPKPSKGIGPTLTALFLIWLVLVSGGIYVYFFVEVDVTDVIDTIQTRAAQLFGQSETEPGVPITSSPPPAEQKISKPPPVRTETPEPAQTEKPSPTEETKQEAPVDVDEKKLQEEEQRREAEEKARKAEEKKNYAKADITNNVDYKIRKKLDEADDLVNDKNPREAITKYEAILAKHPKSPRAQYGVAWATDVQSDLDHSNALLEKTTEEYLKVLDLPSVPKTLLLKAGRRCADRQQFRGWGFRSMQTMRRLVDHFPDDVALWNELGVKGLLTGKNEDARDAFQEALKRDPSSGYAQVHMGFITKQIDGKHAESIPYFTQGLATNDEGVHDGRFYFHLGDALYRTGKHDEAYKVYEQGAEKGIFYSKWQRSLYNVDGLAGRPWWTSEQTGQTAMIKMLEDNWEAIRDEGMAQLDDAGLFIPETEDLRETGEWKQFTLYQRGRKVTKNCDKAPKTCGILDKFEDATKCKRGQIKFSVMHPGVHVWPHCGPTNCRIRAHLGLVIPDGVRLRVTDDTRTWQEGKVTIFDDSFEHEVWHDGNSTRLVLIVDIWHPELTARQRATLSPI